MACVLTLSDKQCIRNNRGGCRGSDACCTPTVCSSWKKSVGTCVGSAAEIDKIVCWSVPPHFGKNNIFLWLHQNLFKNVLKTWTCVFSDILCRYTVACLLIKGSLNVPDHVTPAAFMSWTCQILQTRASKMGRIRQSFFYFLAAVAVGITEPRWDGTLKGKQRSLQFPVFFPTGLFSFYIHSLQWNWCWQYSRQWVRTGCVLLWAEQLR